MFHPGDVVSVDLTSVDSNFLGCHTNGKIIRTYKNGKYRVQVDGCALKAVTVGKAKIRPPIQRRNPSSHQFRMGQKVLAKDGDLCGWWEARVLEVEDVVIEVMWKYSYEGLPKKQIVTKENAVPLDITFEVKK